MTGKRVAILTVIFALGILAYLGGHGFGPINFVDTAPDEPGNRGSPAAAPTAEAEPTDLQPAATAVAPAGQSRCRKVPAMPGVEDFEISSCFGGRWSEQLAGEIRDPSWATAMEARISDRIEEAAGLSTSRTEIVCRNTQCGILLVWPASIRDEWNDEGLKSVLDQRMETALALLARLARETGFGEPGAVMNSRDDGQWYMLALFEHPEDRESLWPPPTAPKVFDALPGIPGFPVTEMSVMPGQDFPTAAELLSGEPVDPAWARGMEARILTEIATMGVAANQLYVACRTTRCGVVLLHPVNQGFNATRELIGGLHERMGEIGLLSCNMGLRPTQLNEGYTVMYFQVDRGPGRACALDR